MPVRLRGWGVEVGMVECGVWRWVVKSLIVWAVEWGCFC